MKNGLYSVHIYMLDGVKGRDSGIFILRDGVLFGGGALFLVDRLLHHRYRDMEGSADHQSAHALF